MEWIELQQQQRKILSKPSTFYLKFDLFAELVGFGFPFHLNSTNSTGTVIKTLKLWSKEHHAKDPLTDKRYLKFL